MLKLKPDDFIAMDMLGGDFFIETYMAYAQEGPPNIFGKIYAADAHLWLHHDLAEIVLNAAQNIHNTYGYTMILYDGLRTCDAQRAMMQTDIVQNNLHWLEPPRLLSPPGAGAHPRGMAIDISLRDQDGKILNMGTAFDFLSEAQDAASNPAHRAYVALDDQHAHNRNIMTEAMMRAADKVGRALLPYPAEWWDFRFMREDYERFAPLSDDDLPAAMRMVALGDKTLGSEYQSHQEALINRMKIRSTL